MNLNNYDKIYSKAISLALCLDTSDDKFILFSVIFIFKLLELIQYDLSVLNTSNKGLNKNFFKHKSIINSNNRSFSTDKHGLWVRIRFFIKNI